MLSKIYTEFPKEAMLERFLIYTDIILKMLSENTLCAQLVSRNTLTQAPHPDKCFYIVSFKTLINIQMQESCKG